VALQVIAFHAGYDAAGTAHHNDVAHPATLQLQLHATLRS
jgi:hypothetical protein